MSATRPQRETPGQSERSQHDRCDGSVGESVLHLLGRPAGFLRVQVRRLWGDYFRVNVFAGQSLACGVVVNSFFVRADAQGRIVSSDPPLAGRG
jgi:hypothetical protein